VADVFGNQWVAEQGRNAILKVTSAGVMTETALTGVADGPGQLALGIDGNVWFTTVAGVAKITPSGVVTAYPVPGNTGLVDITTGPDGALWATDPGSDTVFRITTAGAVTSFGVGTGSGVNGITLLLALDFGCDAAPLSLWATKEGSNSIAKIRVAGCHN
jgi:virginiamycin B lyase